MGRLRGSDFDAVIGIGGICREAQAEGISRKLNWIGIGPKRRPHGDARGPLVVFDHFLFLEDGNIDFQTLAPSLAQRLYTPKSARYLFSDEFNAIERAEVNRILKMAVSAPPSLQLSTAPNNEPSDCGRKCRHKN